MTTRRGFLGGLAGVLAAGFAPAAIGSGPPAIALEGDPERPYTVFYSYTDVAADDAPSELRQMCLDRMRLFVGHEHMTPDRLVWTHLPPVASPSDPLGHLGYVGLSYHP